MNNINDHEYKGGSAYINLWYAHSPNNIQKLSQYTEARIDNTPMFKPLIDGEFATPTSGVATTGIYLSRLANYRDNGSQGLDLPAECLAQRGGGGAYIGLWYARTPSNIQSLSQYTEARIDNTPMFKPLRFDTTLGTPSTGLIPTGIHLNRCPAIR